MKENMPKVSIIVPVYNVEKYLAKCLDSIINQTYKNIEIICVNDGSTDNSFGILKDYAQKDGRIKIINRENGGLSVARNSGLEVATGEYCYFIDPDDWIELYTIEKLVKIITTHDVDVVVHSAENISENDSCSETAQICQDWIDSYSKPNGIYDVPIGIKKEIPIVTWNKLYKMNIMDKFHCRFPEGLVNEDELFVWEYMIHCKNYYYVDEKLYNYLRRTDSITGRLDKSHHVLDIFEIQKRIYKVVEKYKNIEDYKEYLIYNYIKTVGGIFPKIPRRYRNEAFKQVKEYYETVIHDKRILKMYRRQKYRPLIQFLQNIFSIRNVRKNGSIKKRIKFLGFKFDIRKNR